MRASAAVVSASGATRLDLTFGYNQHQNARQLASTAETSGHRG